MFASRGLISVLLTVGLLFNLTAVPPLQAQSRVVPRGTVVKLIMNDSLSTKTTNEGDTFTATVANDVLNDGTVMIRHGAIVNGTVTRLERSKRLAGLRGKASMTLRFDTVNTVSGRRPIAATIVSVHDPVPGATSDDRADKEKVGDEGEVTAKTDKKDILTKGAIGVAAGAVLGALFGNVSRGLLLGGVGGAVAILAPKGRDVQLDKGTGLQIRLDHDLNLSTT